MPVHSSLRPRVHERTTTLESRILHGPVVILTGGRVQPERPRPRNERRDISAGIR